MKVLSLTMTALILCVAISCANQSSPQGYMSTVIKKEMLDTAKVLVMDSTEHRFDQLSDISQVLVYHDSLIITSNKYKAYGEPIVSIYEGNTPLRHLADYIPRGADAGEMVASEMLITGDKLFIYDSFYSRRYVTIPLHKPLPPAENLQLSNSGVEERGVAMVPFRDGVLVENPQCYTNEEVGIHNDVPRLLYYKQGKCQTPQAPVVYQVADVNTGANLHYSAKQHRVCFISNLYSLVEFYDDSLRLVHRVTIPSGEYESQEVLVYAPTMTMHQKKNNKDRSASTNATFDKTQRVVGAGEQFHAFLCSYADDDYIYLAYCGKRFGFNFHTYPSFILVLDWQGNLIDTYRFNRWIEALSPSSERGTFYLTVYDDDDSDNAKMRLVKVFPQKHGDIKK